MATTEKDDFLDTYVALIGFNHSNKPNNSSIAPHPNFTMPLVGFGLGASVYRKIKNWNIGLGLGVLAEREKIKANWKYAVIDTVQQPRLDTLDVYYVQNSAGTLDTITLVELRNYTNYVSQNKEQNIAHNNIYFYLEPRFSIGYNVLHRKLSLCIIGSLIPSILFYANAQKISKISPDKSLQVENHLRSNITLAYGLGLNFCYQLNDKLGIFLFPEYRNDIFSITKSASSTTLTRSGIAGKVGLRIFF